MTTQIFDIFNKDQFNIPITLPGTTPATAANYGLFFIAHVPCELTAVALRYGTASTSGTLQIEKLTGTQALDGGTVLLSSTISMSAAANTTYFGTLTGTVLDLQLARGEALALKDGGTLTSLENLNITVRMKPLGKGHYGV